MSTVVHHTVIDLDLSAGTNRGSQEVHFLPQYPPWTGTEQYTERWGNATAPREPPPELSEELRAIFEVGREYFFEDGIGSEFSERLIALIRKYGDDALMELAYLVLYEKVNAEVASEALRWLGYMKHPPSYHHRQWLLEASLQSLSPRIRDGALLGLAYLDDPHAIPYLKHTMSQEQVEELRHDMEQLLAEFESRR